MPQTYSRYGSMFHDDEEYYYQKLDKYSEPLRDSAHDIVMFIEDLDNKTIALQNLKESYSQLLSIPARNLCSGIEDIKVKLLQVEFLSRAHQANEREQQEFIDFFTLQNAFNKQVNAFVKKVVQLEMFH